MTTHEFNDAVEEAHGLIRALGFKFRPREVLLQMEPVSCRVYLAKFDAGAEHAESDTVAGGASEVAP